jgi:transketolase
MHSTVVLADVALGIRRRVAWMAAARGGAYLGQACSSAEILATLYCGLMDLGPSESTTLPTSPTQPFRPGQPGPSGAAFNGARDGVHDRFILSPAHYSGALYATLAETGRLDGDQFDQYATNGTAMEMIGSEQSPGLEATTGSLAQGLSVGVGMALARKLRGQPGTVWVLISDGELEEGQTWEALAAASHHELGNLVVIVDANAMQVDGTPASIMNVEPIGARMASFGLITHEIDGHDTDAITEAASSRGGAAPVAIVCRTVPWRGMPSLEHRYPGKLHFVRFVEGEADLVAQDLELAEAARS